MLPRQCRVWVISGPRLTKAQCPLHRSTADIYPLGCHARTIRSYWLLVNERGFLSLAVSSASKAQSIARPRCRGLLVRASPIAFRLLVPLCFSRAIFPRLSHPKQSLSVFCVHRLRYADTVSRIFPVRFRVFHCLGLLRPFNGGQPHHGVTLFGAVS